MAYAFLGALRSTRTHQRFEDTINRDRDPSGVKAMGGENPRRRPEPWLEAARNAQRYVQRKPRKDQANTDKELQAGSSQREHL